ncbi:MAG: hypothetical protein MUF49_10825 [Oculatellaceae cyanobacterium Prado106]|nr:hypothetical protein [Oculatellaceae cyanobacterium Prado106]
MLNLRWRSLLLGKSTFQRVILALLTASLVIMTAVWSSAIAPAIAQETRVGDAWQLVYQQMPDFPKENQYINRETGQVSENNTLASRLIRYHVYVKARPLPFRLDWKLTLADYLGINERMDAATYPGGDALRTNPMRSDMAVIQGLTRSQRDQLVTLLSQIFTPPEAATPVQPTAPVQPTTPAQPATPAAPSPAPEATPFRNPQPGDAQLLMP